MPAVAFRRLACPDEAHNIDNVCIEALSVTLDRGTLEGAARNLGRLAAEVKRLKSTNVQRLQDEYARLARGLGLAAGGALAGAHDGGRSDAAPSTALAVASAAAGAAAAAAAASAAASGPASSSSSSSSAAAAAAGAAAASAGGAESAGWAGAGGEDLPAAPVLPTELAEQAIPGNIRNAELFVRFMRHVVRFLKDRIKVAHVDSETPASFLHRMGTTLSVDPKPLRFAYSRLNSLLRTLEVTEVDEFAPISLVADFATLLATYPKGFMVVLEPFNSRTPHIPDPIMQLACLGEPSCCPGSSACPGGADASNQTGSATFQRVRASPHMFRCLRRALPVPVCFPFHAARRRVAGSSPSVPEVPKRHPDVRHSQSSRHVPEDSQLPSRRAGFL